METELLNISEETGVHIIASTGFHKLSFYPADHWIRSFDEKALLHFFIHEITMGMYCHIDDTPPQTSTSIKAGMIKTAFDLEGLTPQYRTLFTAAAKAAEAAGLPFMVHIEQGALLKKVINLEFDAIGRFKYHDDSAELDCIQQLADAGFLNQLLLSLDTTRTRMKSYTPNGIGLDYILQVFLPQLKAKGFTDSDMEQLTIKNCAHIFAG